MKSSNKMNEYLRVGNPGIYILLAFLTMTVILVLIWAINGKLTMTEKMTGIILPDDPSGSVRCTVDASSFNGVNLVGARASFRTADNRLFRGTVTSCPKTPVASVDYADEFVSFDLPPYFLEWIKLHVLNGNYVFPVTITPDTDLSAYEYQLADISVVTAQLSPISFLMQ